MTKVEAIRKVMEANGGSADLQTIYKQAGRYYKGVKASEEWQAGLRGVLYREIRNGKTFSKIRDAKYCLKGLEDKACRCSLWAWTSEGCIDYTKEQMRRLHF